MASAGGDQTENNTAEKSPTATTARFIVMTTDTPKTTSAKNSGPALIRARGHPVEVHPTTCLHYRSRVRVPMSNNRISQAAWLWLFAACSRGSNWRSTPTFQFQYYRRDFHRCEW